MMPMLRRFRDSQTATCSYLLASLSAHRALLIDPVLEQVPLYLGVLDELACRLDTVLDTHLHADHVTAAAALRELTGARIACARRAELEGVDLPLDDGDSIECGDIQLYALATPGHTPESLTYRWEDRLFTGDALLIGGCGRTDEPGGNPGQLYDSLNRRLLPLPDETLIFPGHCTPLRWISCVGEERRNNPMLLGISRDEFIALNRRRQEPPIATMQHNLAANRRCGRAPISNSLDS